MLIAIRDRFLLALQYEDYRTLWTANVCAGAAAWALIVARGWLAYQITDSSLWVGLVTFGAMAPRFLCHSDHRLPGRPGGPANPVVLDLFLQLCP